MKARLSPSLEHRDAIAPEVRAVPLGTVTVVGVAYFILGWGSALAFGVLAALVAQVASPIVSMPLAALAVVGWLVGVFSLAATLVGIAALWVWAMRVPAKHRRSITTYNTWFLEEGAALLTRMLGRKAK